MIYNHIQRSLKTRFHVLRFYHFINSAIFAQFSKHHLNIIWIAQSYLAIVAVVKLRRHLTIVIMI